VPRHKECWRIRGRLAKERLDALIGIDGFATLPPEPRIKLLKQTINHVRESAAPQTMMQSIGSSNDIMRKGSGQQGRGALQGAAPAEVKAKLTAH
jgi:hypothetical protein